MDKQRTIDFLETSFLAPLLGLEGLTDISYNGESLYYMTNGEGRKKADIKVEREEVGDFIRQIANMEEKKWSYSDPLLDLSFGHYRLNAVFSSLVRVENQKSYSFSLRLESGSSRIEGDEAFFGENGREILLKALYEGESIMIGGRTGSGKTELQKWLLLHLPPATRVIVIDNVEELTMIKNPSVDLTMWLSGQSEESYAMLVKNALRSNPDYIVLAEARGNEAYEALSSAMTGHPIITTMHARGLAEMPERFLNMAIKAHEGLDAKGLLKDIKDHFRYYVMLERKEEEGKIVRRIKSIGRLKGGKMEVLCA